VLRLAPVQTLQHSTFDSYNGRVSAVIGEEVMQDADAAVVAEVACDIYGQKSRATFITLGRYTSEGKKGI
jgi:hypothetical protein